MVNGTATEGALGVRLGARLRDLRLGRNYSQAAVAADLCLAPATLSAYERGTRSLTVDRLIVLASYYCVDPADLLTNLQNPFPAP